MGEYAEMMLDGTCCSSCGEYLGGDEGYPVQCPSCSGAMDDEIDDWEVPRPRRRNPPKPRVHCPECGKRVKEVGLADHRRDVHGVRANE